MAKDTPWIRNKLKNQGKSPGGEVRRKVVAMKKLSRK